MTPKIGPEIITFLPSENNQTYYIQLIIINKGFSSVQ